MRDHGEHAATALDLLLGERQSILSGPQERDSPVNTKTLRTKLLVGIGPTRRFVGSLALYIALHLYGIVRSLALLREDAVVDLALDDCRLIGHRAFRRYDGQRRGRGEPVESKQDVGAVAELSEPLVNYETVVFDEIVGEAARSGRLVSADAIAGTLRIEAEVRTLALLRDALSMDLHRN